MARISTTDALLFFNNAPMMLGILGEDGCFLTVNTAFTQITGYTEEEIYQEKLFRILNMQANYGILTGQRKDGTPIAIGWQTNSENQRHYFMGQEITSHKFFQIHSHLKSILNSLDDLVFVIDRKGVFFDFYQSKHNPRLFTSPEDFIGKYYRDILPPDVALKLTQAIHTVSNGAEVAEFDYSLELDENTYWFNGKLSPIASPHFVGYVLVARDIQDRKQSEAALAESQRLYHALAVNLPGMAVLVFDHDLRFLVAEGEILGENGPGKAEMQGKTLYEIFPSEYALPMIEQYKQILTGERVQFKRERDEKIYDAVGVPIYDENHQIIYGMLVIQDVTISQRLLTFLEESLARTQLLYNITHSFFGNHTVSELLQKCVDALAQNVLIHQALIVCLDTEKRALTHIHSAGFVSDNLPREFDEMWEGLTGWVWREKKPTISFGHSPDPRESPRVQARRKENNSGDIIVVPIFRHDSSIFGTITIIARMGDKEFHPEDLELITIIANQLTVALENILLLERLQESESRYRILAANIPNATVILFDSTLKNVLAEGNALNATGLDMSKMIEHRAGDLWEDTAKKAEIERLQRLALVGQTSQFEDGFGERIFDVHVISLNSPHFGMMFYRDITIERHIHQALEASYRRADLLYRLSQIFMDAGDVQQFMQQVTDLISTVLGVHRVTFIEVDFAKHRVVRFVRGGIGVEWAVSIDFEELWQGLGGWVMRENKAILVPKDQFDERESPLVQQHRRERNTGSMLIAPVRMQNQPMGVLTLINHPAQPDFQESHLDIIEIVATQIGIAFENTYLLEKLRENEKRYRQLVENASDIVYVTDRDGKITFINQAGQKLLGYSLEEATQMQALDFSPASTHAETTQFYVNQIRADIEETYHEFPVLAKNGEMRWLGQWVRLLKSEGAYIGTQGTARDITDRKRIEQEREELINELNAFAHTVAHDLKTPLGVVIGYAEVLLEELQLNDEDKHAMQHILRASHQMEQIINELLRLASLRNNEDIAIDLILMDSIIKESLDGLVLMTEKYTPEIHIQEDLPAALGYAPWVSEVWTNYITNAIKYGGRPPVIHIRARDIGSQVRYEVQDNGMGVPSEQTEHLFQEFSRLDKLRVTGHGLGLWIVKRIITRLGGEVGVESLVGQGSTFWFTLPRLS